MGQLDISDAERLLSKVLPPKAILALGAVMPQRLQALGQLNGASITLAHPDETFLSQISASPATEQLNLETRATPISPAGGSVAFYKNSLDRESGFMRAELLKPIWKNLEQTSETELSSSSLDDFLTGTETRYNWLVLDRLDGLQVLEAAPHCLDDFVVAQIRSWSGAPESGLKTSQDAIAFFAARGFHLIAQTPERHPALESLLFAKDQERLEEARDQAQSELQAYKDGQDTDAEKQRKLVQNNLAALEQRYADLLARNNNTEKLIADMLTRLSRADAALGTDE